MSFKQYLEAVSNSRAYVYQKCRMAYSLKYKLRVKPLAKDMHFESWERMFRGTVIHAGMEAALLGKNSAEYIRDEINAEAAKGLSAQQTQALAEIQESSLTVVENLCDWLPVTDFEPFLHEGKPVVELQLTAPLQGWPGGFNGFVDALVRHKPTGRIVCIDWKTKATFGSEGDELYQVQLPLYLYALRNMGIAHVNQFALIEIKSTPPKRAPRKVREDSGTFDGIRASSDGQFRWVPRYVSDAEIQNNWNEFAKMSLSMSRFEHQYAYMSRSPFGCKSCEYKLYCDTALSNGDVEHVLKNNFTTSPQSLRILTEE